MGETGVTSSPATSTQRQHSDKKKQPQQNKNGKGQKRRPNNKSNFQNPKNGSRQGPKTNNTAPKTNNKNEAQTLKSLGASPEDSTKVVQIRSRLDNYYSVEDIYAIYKDNESSVEKTIQVLKGMFFVVFFLH